MQEMYIFSDPEVMSSAFLLQPIVQMLKLFTSRKSLHSRSWKQQMFDILLKQWNDYSFIKRVVSFLLIDFDWFDRLNVAAQLCYMDMEILGR